MKKIIVYSSRTGNTKKIAEAIQSLDRDIPLLNIDDIESPNLLKEFDCIILGGWIDKGTLDRDSLKIAESIKEKKVGYFFTLGADPDSKHSEDCHENITKTLEEGENQVVARFHCQGAIDPKLTQWMLSLPEDSKMAPTPERIERWRRASSHPDETDRVKAMKAFSALISL